MHPSALLALLIALCHAPALADAPPVLDGSLAAYVSAAQASSPRLHAARSRWQSQVHAASSTGRLPDPTVSLGLLARSVETRVGPQLARLSLRQGVPWPGALLADRARASATADAHLSASNAETIRVTQRVSHAWWRLWELRRVRAARQEHLVLLDGLAQTTRARVETGRASLSDLQQLDLTRARLADRIAALGAQERAAQAELAAAIGLPTSAGEWPTTGLAPEPAIPAESTAELVDRALAHPSVRAAHARTQAASHGVRLARSQRAPALTAGVDWVVTGPAAMDGVAESGKDAISLVAGVQVPLWQRSYARQVSAASARRDAQVADSAELELELRARVEQAHSRVLDSARRTRVVGGTLLPQARAVHDSIIGRYAAGDAPLAQVLLAQRDLLELRIEADQVAAEHARAWADLEAACGGAVPRVQPQGGRDDRP